MRWEDQMDAILCSHPLISHTCFLYLKHPFLRQKVATKVTKYNKSWYCLLESRKHQFLKISWKAQPHILLGTKNPAVSDFHCLEKYQLESPVCQTVRQCYQFSLVVLHKGTGPLCQCCQLKYIFIYLWFVSYVNTLFNFTNPEEKETSNSF